MYGGQLHLLVDGCSVDIEGSTENVGETYHIVNLVGIVGTSRRHQCVRACLHCVLVGNLGNGVGQGEDDRVFGHRLDHLL